jgi:glucose/arabinose dehydrogenase
MKRRHVQVLAAATSAVLLVVAATALSVRAAGPGDTLASNALLPDLDQETPTRLGVREAIVDGRRVHVLGFASAIRNIGAGPLEIDGTRLPAGDGTTMSVDQVVHTADAAVDRVAHVGELTFVTSADHDHWHYAGFDRYELRAAGGTRALVRDQKSGFCLGDRYQVTTRVVSSGAPAPHYTDECGLGRPDLTSIVQGISVGFGDNYAAYLEYQDLPLDGLPDGRYVLVHHVNEDRRLRETTYANNAASVLLDLRWRAGTPFIRTLATCPDTDRCDQVARVTTVATGLEVPWDLEFLPDGRALITERPGRVRLLSRTGHLRRAPVARISVSQRGEGGLLGLAVDPAFSQNHLVYLYLTGRSSMRLERWRWTGSRLVRETTLLDAIAAGDVHDSGRIAFGPDQRLYVATGDGGQPSLAQDPDSLNGKFLALTPEQYRGPDIADPQVIASGMRNPQGFDWQPGTGALVSNDHGPSGFDGPEGYDEVDRIVQDGNYGWPDAISDDTGNGAFLAPARIYLDPIAPSGATFLTHADTAWRGQYVLAALRGEELRRLVVEGGRVVADEPFLQGRFGRLRSVTEAPDGSLYVLTSNRDGRGVPVPGDDRVLRVELPRR